MEPQIFVILDNRSADGYTAADVIVSIKGKYVPIENEIILPKWAPVSTYKDMCYPKYVPDRLAMFISGVVNTIEALTGINPSWRYLIVS